jgi:hypothetical protein
MIIATQGRGIAGALPPIAAVVGGGLVQQIYGTSGTEYPFGLGMCAGFFLGAIVLWFCDRGRKKPPPNLTDTDQTPKETPKDALYWIPIRYWAIAWIVVAILGFIEEIRTAP